MNETIEDRREWISASDARERQPGSLLLHRMSDASAHAGAGLVVGALVGVWVVVGAFTDFPTWWSVILEVVSSSITLVIVFTIQHTQARQQSATQRKLDEILRALPGADDRLIAVEEASDPELAALADLNLADRERAEPA